jgi:CheY-like chemotaxis protein
MEQRLQQAQKAESLSRMAGAIAHNFNNLLGGVIGNLELVQEEVCPGSFGETCIHEAMKASKRAATISRFMLTYVGQTSGKPELMDCANALRDACTLLSPSLPANVSFRAELPSLGPIIRVDEAQLTQILTHLMDNAVEAIGEKQGEINLHLDIVPGAQTGELNHCPLQWEAGSKDYACISISDTGGGIDPENLDKIFDPFFTTRFVGRGLGLPVSMGLLRALEGGISVENHPGQGVTFKVFLPILEQVNAPPLRTGASLSSHAPEGGLVLLVDDDLVSRTVAEAQLNRLGYEVVTASGGIEGVDKFRTCKDDFLFVLLDVYMLPMDGWETLAALRSIRPGIPAVFVSGHDEAQLNYEEHTERPQAFLHKPYRLEDLKSALRVVLKS